MRKSRKSCAYWGQWRKMEGRLRAMKPEKQSQRASRDEEEGKEEENNDKIEGEIRFSHRFIIRAGTLIYFLYFASAQPKRVKNCKFSRDESFIIQNTTEQQPSNWEIQNRTTLVQCSAQQTLTRR